MAQPPSGCLIGSGDEGAGRISPTGIALAKVGPPPTSKLSRQTAPWMLDDRRELRLDGENPDGDRLLPGETPMSVNPEEVVHWIAVYSELAEFLRSEAQPSAPSLAERYQRRLAYWVRRLEELTGDGEAASGARAPDLRRLNSLVG